MLTDYIFIAHYPLLSEMNLEQMETFLEKFHALKVIFIENRSHKKDFRIPKLHSVGGIMVLCVNRLYPPVLALRTDCCHYKPGILLLACFFDQIYRNPFSTSSKLWLLGHIIYRWRGIHEEIAAPLES